MSSNVAVIAPDGRHQTVTGKVFKNILKDQGWTLVSDGVSDSRTSKKGSVIDREALLGRVVHETGETIQKKEVDPFDDAPDATEQFQDDVDAGFEALRTTEPPLGRKAAAQKKSTKAKAKRSTSTKKGKR